jgi:hypothetical protein
MIEPLVLSSLWVVFVLIGWFETNAFEYYARYFNFGHWTRLHEYDEEDPDRIMDYLSFIRAKYSSNSFMVALITCPVCLSVWLCVISSIVFSVLYYFPIVYLLSLVVYLSVKRGFFEDVRL